MLLARSHLPPPSGRIDWIDGARGIGILLVVYGHALRGQVVDAGGTAPHWATMQDMAIYAFHMPLFFLLGGLFLERSLRRGRGRFLTDKLWTIAWPYLLWSLVSGLVELGAARWVNSPIGWRDLALIAIRPIEQYWFLYSLFLCQMIVAALLPHRTMLAGLAIVAVGTAGLASGTILAPTLASLIYVVAGLWAMPALFRMAEWPVARLCLLSAVTWVVFAGCLMLHGGIPAHYLAALAGSTGTIAVAMALTRRGRPGFLCALGEASLAIYVLHTIVSAGARIMLDRLGIVLPLATAVWVCAAAGVAGPWLAWHLACRHGLTLPLGFGRGPPAFRTRHPLAA